MSARYIDLPKDVPSVERLVAGWEQHTGFPMVFGAVDGTHIPITQPYITAQDYFSYKMKYTINVQGVCDFKGQFLDVDIRWPGATHDAKVFGNSRINQVLSQRIQPYLCRTISPGSDGVGLLLLGDPAYPLLPHVIKEFATCNNSQVLFNQMLRDARNAIECAYGRLKARWQILTKPINFNLQDVPLIIFTCFVLHNWCEQHKVGVDDCMVQQQVLLDREMQPSTVIDRRYTYTSREGRAVRDILKDYFVEELK